MYFPKYFTPQVIKKKKFSLIFALFFNTVKKNWLKFFSCVFLVLVSNLVNFNVTNNFLAFLHSSVSQDEKSKEAFLSDYDKKNIHEKRLFVEQTVFDRTLIKDKKCSFEFNCLGIRLFKNTALTVGAFLFRMVILCVFIKSSVSIFSYYWIHQCCHFLEKELKYDLLKIFFRSKFEHSSGVARNLQTYIASDVEDIAVGLWNSSTRIIGALFSIFLFLFFRFDFSVDKGVNYWLLAILAFLFVVLLLSFCMIFRVANELAMLSKKNELLDNKKIFESIESLEYVKAVSGEKKELLKISSSLENSLKQKKKYIIYSTLYHSVPSWFIRSNISLFFACIIICLGYLKITGFDDAVFVFYNLVMYFHTAARTATEVGKIIDIVEDLDVLTSSSIAVSKNFVFKEEKKDKQLTFEPISNFTLGDVVFENVVFSYPGHDQKILQDLSFVFKKNKIYGIFGKNGIGKSTITKILIKLFDVSGGSVKINQKNLENIDTSSLHKDLCYQTNSASLFSLTIAENIYYPYPCPKNYKEELLQIAEKVGISEFISKLPNGFDTVLSIKARGSAELSEGQKQQISAMKIFVRQYSIYVLDEILSNVSPDLKKVVLPRIFQHIKKTPAIALVVDHHYEIFSYVDEIYEFSRSSLTRTNMKELKVKKIKYDD